MGSRFVSISQHEFNEFMLDNDFVCINDEQTRQELVYTFMWHEGTYLIKVYSTIVPGDGKGRDVGKDAIRTILFMLVSGEYRPVWKATRVHRTKNWQDNLQKRINEGMNRGCYKRNYKCPICGGTLVGRNGKYGFFFGCSSYSTTGCDHTEKS